MRRCLFLFACLWLGAAEAKQTVFGYDGFYSRLKKSEDVKYSHVTLTFLLQQQQSQQRCQLESAAITTDLTSTPLTLAANGELLLPYDQLLNDNKAKIVLQQPETARVCDLNFRLRNRLPVAKVLSYAELHRLHDQFSQLLNELSGLGKYFLPQMTGVTLLFKQEAVLISQPPMPQAVMCEQHRCQIDMTILPKDAQLEFADAPEYVVPWLAR